MKKAIAYMVGSTIGSSAMMVIVKLYAMDYPVIEIVFFRSLFAFLFYSLLVVFNLHIKSRPLYKTKQIKFHFLHSVVGLLAMVFYFYSLSLLPLAEATAISFSAPLFVIMLSNLILGESISSLNRLLIFIGFLGVVIIIKPVGHCVFQFSSLIAILASFLCASALICLRYLGKRESSVTTSFYYSLFTTIAIIPLLLPIWITPSGCDLFFLCLLGIGGGIEQLLATLSFKYAPAALVSPVSYSSIVWASIFGYIFWNEIIDVTTVTGSAIIIFSTWKAVSINLQQKEKKIGEEV